MRHKTVRIGLAGLIFTLLIGCAPHIRTKTILLPERENPEENLNSGSDELYTVQKIYSREINNGISWAPEIYLDQEHRFRYWVPAGEENDTVCLETAVDYRYGFHEERELPLEEEISEGTELLQESMKQGEDAVSPDGRYAVLIEKKVKSSGNRLYLLNLETGDSTLLLDGDKMECPENEYRIVWCWSPDSKVLCYGFCPGVLTEESIKYDTKAVLHFRQLLTGEQTSVRMLKWKELMDLGKIGDIWLYGDWKEGRLKAVLIYTLVSEERSMDEPPYHVQWMDADGRGERKEVKTGTAADDTKWAVSEILTDTAYGKIPVYLDAVQNRVYVVQNGEITVYNGVGTVMERVELLPQMQVMDVLAADSGNVIITAERRQNHAGSMADICLYQRNGESFTRNVVYMGCGYVYCMEFDPTHRRLLVDASTGVEKSELPFHTWQGIVLEFQ